MTEIPKEYQAAVEEVIRWAESVCLRLTMIEAMMRDHFQISEEAWKQALIEAGRRTVPLGYKLPPMSETAEAIEIHFRGLTEV